MAVPAGAVLGFLLVAFPLVSLDHLSVVPPVGQDVWRAVVAGALRLVALEGVARVVHRAGVGRRTTPYDVFMASVGSHILPGSRVPGLQHYWLGLREHTYRSWLLPFKLSDAESPAAPVSFEAALEIMAPDVVLMDRHMRAFFARIARPSDPDHARYLQFHSFMRRHGARLAGVVDDVAHGSVEIYQLEGTGDSSDTPRAASPVPGGTPRMYRGNASVSLSSVTWPRFRDAESHGPIRGLCCVLRTARWRGGSRGSASRGLSVVRRGGPTWTAAWS
jgi:hypothetical protein